MQMLRETNAQPDRVPSNAGSLDSTKVRTKRLGDPVQQKVWTPLFGTIGQPSPPVPNGGSETL